MNFSLNEIKELFELSAADTANKARIRQVAQARLQQVHEARQNLDLVESTLKTWLTCCEQSNATEPCPIILGLAHKPD
jgi:DNA-binding transcriptional MerR regulator